MEQAVVVGLTLSSGKSNHTNESLEELKRLLETAGGQTRETVLQKRPTRDPATLVGRGKAQEIGELVRREALDLVVVDHDLTPAQQKNLQEIIPAKVIDRTRLILDIFARRARTREGKLQVELAQLNYLLPRVTEKFGRFEQQTGGIGTRGPGERKLEVDQRHIRERITRIKKEIDRLRGHRDLRRENRERVPLPTVALVGYTNVGKSTLLNALTKAHRVNQVYADDKLFATLDPTTRRVKLPGGRIALFVDTVGFIQKLPHHLVAAFHATLEEASDADLLVHVIDAAETDWDAQAGVVRDVLKELQADGVPRIDVFNKADRLTEDQKLWLRGQGRLTVSARTGLGLNDLLEEVESRLDKTLMEKEFVLPHRRRDLLPLLFGAGRIISQKALARGTRYRVRIDPKNWGKVQKILGGSPDL